MAIYRFRISFEDYDEVTRDIDVLSKQTFLDLHRALHASTGYNPDVSSSFYVSNDQWKRGEEIAYLPNERKVESGVKLMESARLSRFIDDPHQKFYYTYNFDRPFDFHVQLIKILKEEGGKEYPALFKSVGQAPKALGAAVIPSEDTSKKDTDDYDFLNETEYGIDEAEDFDLLDGEEQADESGDNDGQQGFEDEY